MRAEKTVGQVFDGIFGKLLQDVDQIFGRLIGINGFFDELGQTIFDADAGAEILSQGGPFVANQLERDHSSATALYFLRLQASARSRKSGVSRL